MISTSQSSSPRSWRRCTALRNDPLPRRSITFLVDGSHTATTS
ncbi:hypothetical protein CGRA01v4_01512 [Colletotrichum graminicola]|nr:hypothetical protein CGRA01v4_01512 [Colletotrichum graminicola]